jgi:hypothetical protein
VDNYPDLPTVWKSDTGVALRSAIDLAAVSQFGTRFKKRFRDDRQVAKQAAALKVIIKQLKAESLI